MARVTDQRLLRAASIFRVLAFVLPIVRLVGAVMRQRSLELDSAASEWGGVLAALPFTWCMSGLLYLLAVQLREHVLAPPVPALVSPPATDAVPPEVELPPERLLDSDAPVDLAPFLPKEPPKMTAVPIGDPHGAFRRPSE